jgi:hypothetical protein
MKSKDIDLFIIEKILVLGKKYISKKILSKRKNVNTNKAINTIISIFLTNKKQNNTMYINKNIG